MIDQLPRVKRKKSSSTDDSEFGLFLDQLVAQVDVVLELADNLPSGVDVSPTEGVAGGRLKLDDVLGDPREQRLDRRPGNQ